MRLPASTVLGSYGVRSLATALDSLSFARAQLVRLEAVECALGTWIIWKQSPSANEMKIERKKSKAVASRLAIIFRDSHKPLPFRNSLENKCLHQETTTPGNILQSAALATWLRRRGVISLLRKIGNSHKGNPVVLTSIFRSPSSTNFILQLINQASQLEWMENHDDSIRLNDRIPSTSKKKVVHQSVGTLGFSKMKRLIRLLPWIKNADSEELIVRIASRSLNSVWQKVETKSLSMCPAEARGYIRATAAPIIEREMGVVNGHPALLSPGPRCEIREHSIRCVVQLTLNKIRQLHTSFQLRSAA